MSAPAPVLHPVGGDPIQSVAVIGAGHKGRLFALRCAQAGCSVVLEDVLSSRLRVAEAEFKEVGGEAGLRIQLVHSVEDAVRDADLAVDFVPDELESKLEIISLMDRMAPPRTVFCTPTSLSITDLASCTCRPDQCVALSGNPEAPEETITVIRGQATGAETLQRVTAWLQKLHAVVLVAEDDRAPVLVRSL